MGAGLSAASLHKLFMNRSHRGRGGETAGGSSLRCSTEQSPPPSAASPRNANGVSFPLPSPPPLSHHPPLPAPRLPTTPPLPLHRLVRSDHAPFPPLPLSAVRPVQGASLYKEARGAPNAQSRRGARSERSKKEGGSGGGGVAGCFFPPPWGFSVRAPEVGGGGGVCVLVFFFVCFVLSSEGGVRPRFDRRHARWAAFGRQRLPVTHHQTSPVRHPQPR